MVSNVRPLTRRDFLRMAASLAAGGVLAACGSAAPGSGAQPDAPAADKLQLDWWSHTYKPWNEELTRQKEQFEAETSDVQITYTIYPGEELTTKFTTALQAGTGPDIMGAHSWMTPQLIAGDHVAEAPEWVVADIKERFFPVCIDGATFNGKTYAYNQHIGGRQMIANTGLFEENDVALPESWEDMLDLIDAIDKEEGGVMVQAVANYDYTGEGLFASWGTILMSYGGQILADDLQTAAFNSDIGREVTEVWTKFVHTEMGNSPEVWLLGQTAILERGPWMRASIETNAPDIEFKALPVLKGTEAQLQCDYVWNWLVNNASSAAAKEAAFKFTQWLNSVENQVSMYKASSLIPTTKEALEHPEIAEEEWARTFVAEIANKYQYVAKISNWQEVDKSISDEFSLLATGDLSVEETLTNAEDAVNKLLEEAAFFG